MVMVIILGHDLSCNYAQKRIQNTKKALLFEV